MNTNIFRAFVFITLGLSLSACRLVLTVPEGGEVHAYEEFDISGPRLVCDEGSQCTRSIATPGFVAHYTALPHAGFKFAGWSQEQSFVCGPGRGSSSLESTECIVDNSSFAGIPELEALVADDAQFVNAAPIFIPEDTSVPIVDTVSVAGRVWAQPADFVGLSWEGINRVCPGGACGPGAILRGFDMEGWNLATVDDVNALGNHYLSGQYFMGPGPDEVPRPIAISTINSIVYLQLPSNPPVVFADGPFRATPVLGFFIGITAPLQGLTLTENGADPSRVHVANFALGIDRFFNIGAVMTTLPLSQKDSNSLSLGAFFYRLP